MPEDEAEMIRMASPMHDIGELVIPDRILNKPDRLTPEEFDIPAESPPARMSLTRSGVTASIKKPGNLSGFWSYSARNGAGTSIRSWWICSLKIFHYPSITPHDWGGF